MLLTRLRGVVFRTEPAHPPPPPEPRWISSRAAHCDQDKRDCAKRREAGVGKNDRGTECTWDADVSRALLWYLRTRTKE